MLKKSLSYSLAVILILALALSGCGGSGGGNKGGTTPTTSDSDLINGLLDKFQSGMLNKNVELIASLCAYPTYLLSATFATAEELMDTWQETLDTMIDLNVFEFNSRIIIVNGDSATVDAYMRQVTKTKNEEDEDTIQDHTFPVKITVTKVNGTWKILRIEISTDIEKHLINNLLDQYQTAMKNMDADTLVSLCKFPFYDNSVQYNDATTMKTAYQTKFAQTESFSVYEIKDRVFSGIGLTASIHIKKKPLGGDWLEFTDEYNIGVEKVDGVWKVFGIIRKEDP